MQIAYVDMNVPQAQVEFQKFKATLAQRYPAQYGRLNVSFVAAPLLDAQGRDDVLTKQIEAMHPAILMVTSAYDTALLRRAFPLTPIIFQSTADAKALGLISSFSKPGNRMTGLSYYTPIEAKQLELLHDCFPHLRQIGVLADTTWLNSSNTAQLAANASVLGLALSLIIVSDTESASTVARLMDSAKVDGWLIPMSYVFFKDRDQIIHVANAKRQPAMFPRIRALQLGAAMAYEDKFDYWHARWADQLVAVATGSDAGNIPVDRPREYELWINVEQIRPLKPQKTCLKRATGFM